MATPPNPDNPTIKVELGWTQVDSLMGGNRLFFNFSGARPTGAQCLALATYILGTDFPDELASAINEDWTLTSVDVIDITDDTGRSGTFEGSEAGTRPGTPLPAQCAAGVEFDIDLRYRGGKPRIYWPPPVAADLENPSHYTSGFVTLIEDTTAAFIGAIQTTGLVSSNDLTHVNLSYYKGYNTATPPWRGPGFKYPPKYRATAVSTKVDGYAAKTVVASQKRRRLALSA